MADIANRFVVFLDANVLFPFLVRDILLSFAEAGLYRARWSSDVLDEWQAAATRKWPTAAAKVQATRAQMKVAFPEAEVDGYRSLIAALALPDEDDRHVLAAAISTGAQVIVTENLKDFPIDVLAPFNIEALTADDVLVSAFDLYPLKAMAALRRMRNGDQNPAMDQVEFLAALGRSRLFELAGRVRSEFELLQQRPAHSTARAQETTYHRSR